MGNFLLQSFFQLFKHSSLHLLFDFLLKAQSETSYRLITGINDTGRQFEFEYLSNRDKATAGMYQRHRSLPPVTTTLVTNIDL
jgi:hypothetical protein